MNYTRYLLTALLALLLAAPAMAGGNVHFVIGEREVEDDDFFVDFDADSQGMFGVNFDWGAEDWPVRLAAGIHLSGASDDAFSDNNFIFDDDDVGAAIFDISFGMVWVPFPEQRIHPFLGAGFARVAVAADNGFDEDTDRSFGFYVHGGVYWTLGENFHVGIDGRILRSADVQLFGERTEADYNQLGLSLGFGW